ncbi:MAG: aldose epimerase [Cyanobacteria bacterium P01_H01_bin.121]
MFEIQTEQSQYKTYTLTDQAAQTSVAVVPERGGIITSWQVQGNEMFYLDRDRFADPSLSVRGGIPLLFPICGNLPDNTYTYQGNTYQLKQHGFGRTSPWTVTQQTTAGAASLTVSLKSNAETKTNYPFEFELNYIYTLKGNTLELRCQHHNQSEAPMPFSTGIHPYFAVADKSRLSIDWPSHQYRVKSEATLHEFAGEFDFDQDEIDFAFVNLERQAASVTDRDRQLKLIVSFDEHYPILVFWTVKGKDFYCVEPWTGPRNALNTGTHLITAAPGATVETVITMAVEAV